MVQNSLMNGTDDAKTIYPFAPIDSVLEKLGLPKTRPIANAFSPENVLGRKLQIPPPGEVLEKLLLDIDSKVPSGGGLPKPPGFR